MNGGLRIIAIRVIQDISCWLSVGGLVYRRIAITIPVVILIPCPKSWPSQSDQFRHQEFLAPGWIPAFVSSQSDVIKTPSCWLGVAGLMHRCVAKITIEILIPRPQIIAITILVYSIVGNFVSIGILRRVVAIVMVRYKALKLKLLVEKWL
jgi:hypothetical protein